MKRILPILLMLLGAAEIVLAVMDIRTLVLIAFLLGSLLIASGVKALWEAFFDTRV